MNKTSDVIQYLDGAKEMGRQAANSAVSTVQDTVQSGVSKVQDALLVGLGTTEELLKGKQKHSAKNFKKAQKRARKNLKHVQGTLQENVQSGLSQTQDVLLTVLDATQDVLGKSSQKAAKGLKAAQKNVQDTQHSLQSHLDKRARRRKRAKTMFRLGLLMGFVVMLLYTPWPGSETRRQLVAFWQGLFPSQKL